VRTLAFCALAAVAGCAENRATRHFQMAPWRDGLREQFANPERAIVETAALTTTLALLATHEAGLASDAALDHEATTGDTSSSDEYRDGLRWAALGWSGLSLARGDRGQIGRAHV
jgi:hypothetical protein